MFKSVLILIVIYNNFVWPFDMNLERFVPITINKQYLDNFNGHVSKYNRSTYMLNCNADLFKQIDARYRVRLDLFAKQGNEYRRIFTKIAPDACKFMMEDKLFYYDLVSYSNLPTECPVMPNTYRVTNYTLKFPDNLPAIFLTAEHWKMYGAVELDQPLGAIEVYFNIKPY